MTDWQTNLQTDLQPDSFSSTKYSCAVWMFCDAEELQPYMETREAGNQHCLWACVNACFPCFL